MLRSAGAGRTTFSLDSVVCAGTGAVEDSAVVEVIGVRTEVVVLVITAEVVFCVGTRAVEVAPGAETVVATGGAVVVEVSGIVAWVAVVLVSVLEGLSSLGTEPLCT